MVLRALADPTRRAILMLVWGDELPAGDISAHFPISRPAVSQHQSVLKAAGLVTERREATRRYYRAAAEPLAGVRGFLEHFRDDRLARLRRLAEEESRKPSTAGAPGPGEGPPPGLPSRAGAAASADLLPANPPPSLEQPHPGPERPRLR